MTVLQNKSPCLLLAINFRICLTKYKDINKCDVVDDKKIGLKDLNNLMLVKFIRYE